MDFTSSLIAVVSVLAAVFVPQALASFFVAPRSSESETYELNHR